MGTIEPSTTAPGSPGTVNSNEWDFIHEDLPDSDRALFFGPVVGNENLVRFPSSWSMFHILHRCGVFKSVNEARKNHSGNLPIPPGFSEFERGKGIKFRRITILNLFPLDI